jgi:hypothetical protein
MSRFKNWLEGRSYRNRPKDNPPEPKQVYRQGTLYYTTSYMWVDLGSKEAQIFKSGWTEWRHMNYAHPLMTKEIEKVKKAQEEIRKSAEVDWAKMKDIYFDI